jgi:hypothetical protein
MTLEMLSVSEIGRRMFKVINFAQTNIGKQSSFFFFFLSLLPQTFFYLSHSHSTFLMSFAISPDAVICYINLENKHLELD